MVEKKRLFKNLNVCTEELISNGGLHEVFTKEGSFRFFLMDGEKMPKKYMKLLVENKELNLAQVPLEQRKKMEARIDAISVELEKDLG